MNLWKFIGFMLLASLGIYGVCVLFDSEFKMEYILGIAIPLSVGIIVVFLGNWICSYFYYNFYRKEKN